MARDKHRVTKLRKDKIHIYRVGTVAFFLLQFPLLVLLDQPRLVLGVPWTYLYIFIVWMALAIVLWALADFSTKEDSDD